MSANVGTVLKSFECSSKKAAYIPNFICDCDHHVNLRDLANPSRNGYTTHILRTAMDGGVVLRDCRTR